MANQPLPDQGGRVPVGDGIGWRGPHYTHQCPVCLVLTEGEQTCVGDRDMWESHNPVRTRPRVDSDALDEDGHDD